MTKPIVVIGAGPAGLAAAAALNDEALLLERSNDVGGGSRTVEFAGGYFDIGGHSFHTPHPDIHDLVFDALEMYEQKRDARCYTHGNLIPYPFQRSYQHIQDEAVVEACRLGLEQVNPDASAANFEEFINNKFGPGIAEHFMLPYNRKLWGRDLKRLTADWTGERVASAQNKTETFSTSGGKRKPLQANTKVAYPAQGGFGEVFKAIGKRVPNKQFQTEVKSIDTDARTLTTQDGSIIEWRELVSTMPLPYLLQTIKGAPQDLIKSLEVLESLSLKVVMVAINHPVDTDIQRIYSAGSDIPAHKIAINHNSSDWLRKQPHHGIMGELSYSDDKPLAREDLEAWFIESLVELGVVKDPEKTIAATRVVDVKHGYPVPTFNRNAIVGDALGWLEERGIHSVGRFGQWAYINSDEAMHRGFVLGNSLRNSQSKES